VYALLRERLPHATIVSIGHRSTLRTLHHQSIEIEHRPARELTLHLDEITSLPRSMEQPAPCRMSNEGLSVTQGVDKRSAIPTEVMALA
jgi:hypothetical protein